MTVRVATAPHESPPRPPRGKGGPPALAGILAGALRTQSGRTTIGGAIVGFGLLAAIFRTNLQHLVMSWSTDENYSHGFLVPLIGLYFANLAAERGPIRVRGGGVLGAFILIVALLAKLSTAIIAFGTLGDLAFIAALAGLCALLAGVDALRRYGFAIAFLLFMIPLPVALYALIASPLQLAVSQFASVALNATGVPVLTEGNMMTLPGGVQMFVAEACSGMRQLTGFLALTAAVAYLTSRPAWYRIGVVASAVPIAMTANVARVVLTGYIMYHVNPEYASGAYHTIEGLLMLGFGLSLLRAECWVLDQVAALSGPAEATGPALDDRERFPPAPRQDLPVSTLESAALAECAMPMPPA